MSRRQWKTTSQGGEKLQQKTHKQENVDLVTLPQRPELQQLFTNPQNQKCNLIYEIQCQARTKTYIGETGITFNTRNTEHQTKCEKETARAFTRAEKATISTTIRWTLVRLDTKPRLTPGTSF